MRTGPREGQGVAGGRVGGGGVAEARTRVGRTRLIARCACGQPTPVSEPGSAMAERVTLGEGWALLAREAATSGLRRAAGGGRSESRGPAMRWGPLCRPTSTCRFRRGPQWLFRSEPLSKTQARRPASYYEGQ